MNTQTCTGHRSQRGMSLVELMLSMLLSAFLLILVVTMFTATRRSSAFDVQMLLMQENGRFAMRQMVHAMEMAGFYGALLDTSLIDTSGTSLSEDCGAPATNWGLDLTLDELEFVNDATSSDTDDYACLDAEDIVAGSDLIAVRYVSGTPLATLTAGGTYLRGDRQTGTIFQDTTPPALPTGVVQDWRYQVKLFYVQPWSQTVGDGIPSLCIKRLATDDTTFETQCLAEGIELIHFEFGVDSDDDLVVDYYTGSPSNSEIRDSVQVRIYMLLRSIETVADYTNEKAYQMGDRAEAARNDGYLRRVLASSVTLRNSDKLKIQAIVD